MAKKAEVAKQLAASEMGRLRPGTLELVFDRNITVDSLHKAVDTALKWHGCVACGLNGIDLRFRIQDPVFEVFNEVKGLRDINVFR